MSNHKKTGEARPLPGSNLPSRVRRGRRRGAMMMEAVLAVGVATAMIGVTTAIISSEHDKQTAQILGNEGGTVIEAARQFISQNYSDLQQELYDRANTGGGSGALLEFSTAELIDRGYLTPAFADSGVIKRIYGQDYNLLIRAVDRADTSVPQATLSRTELDPTNTGSIDPLMLDRDPSNGEMDIEAIVVTSGGQNIRSGMAGNIIQGYNSPYAGYVNRSGTADGLYGSFSIDMSPYSALSSYPVDGHFASVVALSSFGVLGGTEGEGGTTPGAFDRCAGLDITTDAYLDCLSDNNIYTDIVINNFDSDNDGTIDKFPAIRGINMVQCVQDSDQNTDSNVFLIDCATTKASGNLEVAGFDNEIGNLATTEDTVTFAGGGFLQREEIGGVEKNVLTTNRVRMMDVNGGQDLSEAIIDSRIVFAGETVPKPICPAFAQSGHPMEPRIYVSPAAYSDPEGRAIIGVRAFAEDASATEWRVRLMAFVGQDFCTNTTADPIQFPYTLATASNAFAPSGAPASGICSTFEPDGTVDIDRSDNLSDVYELNNDAGAVLVQTRCY